MLGLLLACACGDDASDAEDGVARYVAATRAVEQALCACGSCGPGAGEGEACIDGALREHTAAPEALSCRAEWLETVARCAAAADCDRADLPTCREPLVRLESLCGAWPEALASALAACQPVPDASVCAGEDGGCGAVTAPAGDGASFVCADGSLVAWAFRCDFRPDCPDGSDEQGCEDVSFECDDGASVPIGWRCDLEADCADGSDERDCAAPFTCEDGRELPAHWLCDGVEDCGDGADERDCP